jgi:hypothetical protein
MSSKEQELFEIVWRQMVGQPSQVVWGVAMNLMVNVIRQGADKRKDAEAVFDELMRNAKTILLHVHYDQSTGNRREVLPFTHVARMPFHQEKSVIFHGQ